MRAPIVILALAATPFIADVSAAQGKAVAKGKNKDECLMPGLRKGHDLLDWILTHVDKACVQTPPPPPPPTPTPDPTPTPTPDPTPTPTPDPTPTPTPTPSPTGIGLSGVLWGDLDWSEMPDQGEPRLGGWTVSLLHNGAVAMTTSSNGNGEYSFSNLPVGDYIVCVTPKANFVQLPPPSQPTYLASLVVSCPSDLGYKISATTLNQNTNYIGVNFRYVDTTGF